MLVAGMICSAVGLYCFLLSAVPTWVQRKLLSAYMRRRMEPPRRSQYVVLGLRFLAVGLLLLWSGMRAHG